LIDRIKVHGTIVTKFFPDQLATSVGFAIIGQKKKNDQMVEVLIPMTSLSWDEFFQNQSLFTKDLSLLPRKIEDEGLAKNTLPPKLIFVDCEYIQKDNEQGSQWLCPLAAYTVVDHNTVMSPKTFVDPHGISPGDVGKCKVALRFQGFKNGQRCYYPVNGGIAQMRKELSAYVDKGYHLVAKGPRTEAIVLNDIGVSDRIPYGTKRKTTELRTKMGNTVMVPFGSGKYSWVTTDGERKNFSIIEMGGLKIESLRKAYFDRLTYDILLGVYETGAYTLKHHPAVDTFIFAHHYVSNIRIGGLFKRTPKTAWQTTWTRLKYDLDVSHTQFEDDEGNIVEIRNHCR